MRAFLKNILYKVLALGGPTDSAAILMYHGVGADEAFSTVRPAAFKEHIAYISKYFTIVPLAELTGRIKAGKSVAGLIAITFDDAYENIREHALPALRECGIPATIFAPTKLLGAEYETSDGAAPAIMSADAARALAREPLFTLASHTRRHESLDEISIDAARETIDGAREDIMELGGTPDLFAYPKGRWTPAVVEHLRSTGFRAAVTVREGHVASGASDPLLLPRLSIDSTTTSAQLRGKLSKWYGTYTRFKRMHV